MKTIRLAAGVLCFAMAATLHAQENYPTKSITIINGFAPGATFDLVSRLVGNKLQERLGWRFLIDSRPGADGRIGSRACADAKNDGYTLCVGGSSTNAIHAAVFKSLPYDIQKDFAPIAFVGYSANVLAVNPSFPAKTVAELVSAAKERGRVTYATAGTGTSTHIAGENFKDATKINTQHVAYKGGVPAYTAAISNEVPMVFGNASSIAPHLENGRLRALAVTSLNRLPTMPDVPSLNELGMKGFDVGPWYAFYAPAGVDPKIIQKLNKEINAVLELPDVKETLRKQHITPKLMTPTELKQFGDQQISTYKEIAQKSNIALDATPK
jgi:tripartite-type tricarboxylate transporter receptor subunit TctC